MKNIILASASPRRRELLTHAGFSLTIVNPDADETWPSGGTPEEAVMEIARRKLNAVGLHDHLPVLAADTVVWQHGEAIGKPTDRDHARRMLRQLSGTCHTVITGFCVGYRGRILQESVKTEVWFRPLSNDDIEDYLATGEGDDKAGSYAVQGIGAGLVDRIEGSYTNIIGLPVREVIELLKKINQ